MTGCDFGRGSFWISTRFILAVLPSARGIPGLPVRSVSYCRLGRRSLACAPSHECRWKWLLQRGLGKGCAAANASAVRQGPYCFSGYPPPWNTMFGGIEVDVLTELTHLHYIGLTYNVRNCGLGSEPNNGLGAPTFSPV